MKESHTPPTVIRRRAKHDRPTTEQPTAAAPKNTAASLFLEARAMRDRPRTIESANPAPVNPYLDVEAMRDRPAPSEKPAERPKGVVPPRRTYALIDNIEPVALFMAYHLGVTDDDRYQPQNLHEVARRFRTSPGRINEALSAYEIDADTVMNTDFDMAMAQFDIRVAPEGVSRKMLGRQLYEEFRDSPRVPRDWAAELRADAEANRRIFDKLK
jgi:hypothetical protein